MITQKHWRVAGGVSLACCALLAYWGTRIDFARESLLFLSGYWLGILLCLVASLYCALLDLLFIRAQYAAMRRDLFEDTLGKEALRRALEEAQKANPRPNPACGDEGPQARS